MFQVMIVTGCSQYYTQIYYGNDESEAKGITEGIQKVIDQYQIIDLHVVNRDPLKPATWQPLDE